MALLLGCGRIGYDDVSVADAAAPFDAAPAPPDVISVPDDGSLFEVAPPVDAVDVGPGADRAEERPPAGDVADLPAPPPDLRDAGPADRPPDTTAADRPPDQAPPIDTGNPVPPSPAFAAVSDFLQSSDPGSISFPHTVGNGAGRHLLVGVAMETASVQVTAVTYRGLALARVGRLPGAGCALEIWQLANPPSGAGQVGIARDGPTETIAMALSFTGVGPAVPTSALVAAVGTTSPVTLGGLTADDSYLFVDAICLDHASPVLTAGAGQSVRASRTGSTFAAGMSTVAASPGRRNMTWTFNGVADGWAATAVSLPPARN